MLNLTEKKIALCERFSIYKSLEWYQHRFFFQFHMLKLNYVDSRSVVTQKVS